MSVPVAYEVFALKTPASSDNKIHEDSVARSSGCWPGNTGHGNNAR
jgi:hypothetical protein